MRRLAVLVLVVAACAGHRNGGAAWPKSAGTVQVTDPADDGGESLEPRTTDHPAAAIEVSEEPAVVAVIPDGPAAEGTVTATPPTVTPPPREPVTETMEIQVEEITITPADPPAGP